MTAISTQWRARDETMVLHGSPTQGGESSCDCNVSSRGKGSNFQTMESKREKSTKTVEMLLACLFLLAITSIRVAQMDRKARGITTERLVATEGIIQALPRNKNCVIHVHGLHHSGTGFTRQVVYDSLGGDAMASMHYKTRANQDEGQHLQTVYPAFRLRKLDPELCGESRALRYNCAGILYLASRVDNKIQLYQEWSKHWNTSKPYLIQKTPTLDVVFLEQMKLHPTFHVIVMRHPFSFKGGFLPKTWFEIWTHILEQLAHGMVESFAVVNYEELVANRMQVERELSTLIQHECNVETVSSSNELLSPTQSLTRHTSRRLELHKHVGNATEFLAPSKFVDLYANCSRHSKCSELMRQSSPILSEIGYNWDPGVPFRSPFDSSLLFTPSRLPPSRLVQKMNELLVKTQHIKLGKK